MVQQEDREHRPLTSAPKFDRPIVVEDFQRTEDSEVQHGRASLPTLPARLPTYNRLLPLPSRAAGVSSQSGRIGRPAKIEELSPCSVTPTIAVCSPPPRRPSCSRPPRRPRPPTPIHDVGFSTEPERLQVVRVQVDEGLDWGDAGLGAVGMLALVFVGYGGARALSTRPSGGIPARS